jgi:FtsH-binding integral membrane protein
MDITFLTKIFLTLLSQLLITFFVAYSLQSRELVKEWYWFILLVIAIILMLFLVACIFNKNLSIPVRLALFTIFSGIFGVLLSRIPKQYNKLVKASIIGTICLFVVLFFGGIAITSLGYNLIWMSTILLASLVGLIIGEIMCSIFEISNRGFMILGLIIYSLFVIYDTNIILRLKQDFVSSALMYYTDIIGIFTRILQLSKN